jgi:hypothetical protein
VFDSSELRWFPVSPNDLLETPLPPNRSQAAAAVVAQALASLPTSVLQRLPRRKNGHSAVSSTSAGKRGADVSHCLCLYLHLDGPGASSKARWAVRNSALHLVPEAAGARSGEHCAAASKALAEHKHRSVSPLALTAAHCTTSLRSYRAPGRGAAPAAAEGVNAAVAPARKVAAVAAAKVAAAAEAAAGIRAARRAAVRLVFRDVALDAAPVQHLRAAVRTRCERRCRRGQQEAMCNARRCACPCRRPGRAFPSASVMASSASRGSSNLTKPKPLERPVSRFITTCNRRSHQPASRPAPQSLQRPTCPDTS